MHKQAKHKSIASKKFQISRERNIATPSTLYNLSDNAKKKKKADKEKKA